MGKRSGILYENGRSNYRNLLIIVMIMSSGYFCPAQLFKPNADWGEFGGSLSYLRSRYSGPLHPAESNHFIDLLSGQFRLFAHAKGLTNNNSLFVISHGKALKRGFRQRYALYPTLLAPKPSYYSARDLAQMLGTNACRIHNIFLAGCNVEDALAPGEFKKYFFNATNIVHARPETDASVDAFQNIFAHSSAEIRSGAVATLGNFFSSQPMMRKKNKHYVAELYLPGSLRPYKQQAAGRELLTGDGRMQLAANTHTNTLPRFIRMQQ